MDTKNYQETIKQMEAPIDIRTEMRCSLHDVLRSNHAIFGIMTELGEMADIFKRFEWYGSNGQEIREDDKDHIREELGDIMWYVALLANVWGFDLDDILFRNIAKLQARYPNGFTVKAATQRDIAAEREASGLNHGADR